MSAGTQNQANTGFRQMGFATMGAWLSYGLGSANENLPAFVVLLSQAHAPHADASLINQMLAIDLRFVLGAVKTSFGSPPGVPPVEDLLSLSPGDGQQVSYGVTVARRRTKAATKG